METATQGILSYLQQPEGVPICISSAIEQLNAVRMIWGVTNLKEDRKDVLGLMIPALNWALCTAYEESFAEEYPSPTVTQRRDQLGSLLSVTFMHEMAHGIIRWCLRSVYDGTNFFTPDLDGREGEAGWEFEYLMFRGVLQASWDAADVVKSSRFNLIKDVWLQDANHIDEYSPLRRIPTENLRKFHRDILDGILTFHTILDVSNPDGLGSVTPYTVVTGGARVLFRATPRSRGQMPTIEPTFRDYIPHCGLALERMEKRGVPPPKTRKYFWNRR
ncbi:hypothetical protein C8R44DRAFT_813116 [Mycena epipterygia]|nr:hypothetical protein C8R44DRAFT_813116 [Mycena epipterygia]